MTLNYYSTNLIKSGGEKQINEFFFLKIFLDICNPEFKRQENTELCLRFVRFPVSVLA